MLHRRNDAGLRSRISVRQVAWPLSYGIEVIQAIEPLVGSRPGSIVQTRSASIDSYVPLPIQTAENGFLLATFSPQGRPLQKHPALLNP